MGGKGKEELEMASYCSDAVLQTDHRAAMRDTLQGKLAAGEPRTEREGGGIPVLFLLLLDCCELGHPSSTKRPCNWD